MPEIGTETAQFTRAQCIGAEFPKPTPGRRGLQNGLGALGIPKPAPIAKRPGLRSAFAMIWRGMCYLRIDIPLASSIPLNSRTHRSLSVSVIMAPVYLPYLATCRPAHTFRMFDLSWPYSASYRYPL